MTRFLMSVALAVTALAFTTTAEAAGQRNGRSEGRGEHFRSHSEYHLRYGTKFSHGYFYKGRDHFHWTYRYHWAQYGCDCYWCPSTCCWYYFNESRDCYLPVSYIREAPPVFVNNNNNNNAAAAAAASSANQVAPTIVTNVIGAVPQSAGPVALPTALPGDQPPLPPVNPNKVTNTAVAPINQGQPIGPTIPGLPGR